MEFIVDENGVVGVENSENITSQKPGIYILGFFGDEIAFVLENDDLSDYVEGFIPALKDFLWEYYGVEDAHLDWGPDGIKAVWVDGLVFPLRKAKKGDSVKGVVLVKSNGEYVAYFPRGRNRLGF